MRVAVPICIVIAMLVAMVGIAFYGHYVNRRDAGLLTDELLESIEGRIAAEVGTYLAPAERMLAFAENVAVAGPVLGDDRELAESLGRNVVEAYPQLYSFLFADPGGNFMMLKRMESGAIDTWHVRRNGDVQASWTRRDTLGNVTGTEPADGTYDPRKRPWYRGAATSQRVFWTDAYVFFTDRTLGITASLPVHDARGRLRAVLGVDILLGSLSEFLGRLEISENGIALIVDNEGGLIAHPDIEQMVTSDGDSPRRRRIQELGDARLDRAFDRFRVEHHGRREIELDGVRYVSIAYSLAPKVGRDWSLLIVAPESDFVGFVSRNNRMQLFLSAGVLGLAALLAVLMAVQGLRADSNARLVGERQRQFESQSEAYAALSAQATLFDEGDEDALLELTEVVTRALGVRRASVWRAAENGESMRCDDCFDRDCAGHTKGVELQGDVLAELWPALGQGDEVVAPDAREDPRTRALHDAYLKPFGCSGLAAVPVRHAGRTLGAVWLEDDRADAVADPHAVTFARTVANMLALRLAVDGRPQAAAAPAPPEVRGPPPAVRRRTPGSLPAGLEQMRRPDLSAERARKFFERLEAQGAGPGAGATPADATDAFPLACVLVLKSTSLVALGQRMSQRANGAQLARTMSAADHLVRETERLADALTVPYVKMMGDYIVCAAGLEREPEADEQVPAGVHDMADFSMALQECCLSMYSEIGHHQEFRIGADLGPVLGATVGGERAVYNLWGDAVTGATVLADTGPPGCVQVSQSVYDHLADHYLFRQRGSYYAPDVGETATYILTGRL